MERFKPRPRPPSRDRSDRASFSSVRETDSSLAQTFTSTKVSSYSRAGDEAVDDQPSPPFNMTTTTTQFVPPITQPQSRLHGCWFPAVAAEGFRGWKQIDVKGRIASKSFSDLPSLGLVWSTPATETKPAGPERRLAGQSAIERLPPEILGKLDSTSRLHEAAVSGGLSLLWLIPLIGPTVVLYCFGDQSAAFAAVEFDPRVPPLVQLFQREGTLSDSTRLLTFRTGPIIDLLVIDIPPNGLSARNVDLMCLLMTSRTMHAATLNSLYKQITIPHSRIFRKYLTRISQNSSLGTIARRLDFSHFNVMIFATQAERASTKNLTPQTLLECLELTPYLQEFLAQEYIEDELNEEVLRKLFFGLPRLQAVDLTGCSSASFKNSMLSVLSSPELNALSISRLSLHQCLNLPSSAFETLLPMLGNLTHLDVAGTRITDEALLSIPDTARISHLNLAKCKELTAENVIHFFRHHPAVKTKLVYLSLAMDVRSHQLLEVDDVTQLLQVLPGTLKSLSLKGSKMDSKHIDMLRPLTKHLEELALGRRLRIADIDRLFTPDENDDDLAMQLDWVPHTLKYLDLSDYRLAELDIGALFSRNTSIMKSFSAPLEVLEVTEDVYKRLDKSSTLEIAGWTTKVFGARQWLVRCPALGDIEHRDLGYRPWKMGAAFWGLRKVPVAVAEVGGMYGNYMFKRQL